MIWRRWSKGHVALGKPAHRSHGRSGNVLVGVLEQVGVSKYSD
jgi:hypothetical protein